MATVIDRHSQPTWRDFLELTKPKVVVLMLITSLIGMLLATKAPLDGFVPWQVLIFGNLGIGLCAGAAAAVNHVVDRRIDSIMARTHKRPLAEGRVSPSMALGGEHLVHGEAEDQGDQGDEDEDGLVDSSHGWARL